MTLDFDLAQLAQWMTAQLGPAHAPFSAVKFAAGQSNPTYRLTTQAGALVLRRKPFGALLRSAHAIEREYRVIKALAPAGFPVPAPVALCEDADIIGAPFYLMELVEGRNFQRPLLPEETPCERAALYRAAIELLGQLHQLDPLALGLESFGKPTRFLARQVELWTAQYRAAQTDDLPEMEQLIKWLPSALPAESGCAIVHGDFRLDNLIFASAGPEVLAVIDWELATLGDPLADLTSFLMNWLMPAEGPYGIAGDALATSGIPSIEEAVAIYCAQTGRSPIGGLDWYFAYNLFRFAAIAQGVKRRVLDGNASNMEASDAARRVPEFAKLAWQQAKKAGAA